MENKKKMILILVIMLAIGFAAVSTTLVITGLVGIASKQDDFKVIFTNAILDNVERKEFIKGEEKQLIDYVSNELTVVNDTTTLEYEVTNTSRIYDAEVNITCNIVDEENNETTSEYVEMKYTPNKMTVSAGESKSGSITAKLIKSSAEPQDIRVKCKLNATATERDTLGSEYNAPPSLPAGVELIDDVDNNGEADIGDEIAIGEEHFYVISHTDTELNAFAKYNLNVGSNKNPNATEGIQHETVKGWLESGTLYGDVAFSNSNGWDNTKHATINIKDYDGPIKTALYGENGYENYIKDTIPTAQVRLIEKGDIEELINDGNDFSYQSIKDSADIKGYSWLYSTSYWTQSSVADFDDRVWQVSTDGLNFGNYYYNSAYGYGVRPVVTIPLTSSDKEPSVIPTGTYELIEDVNKNSIADIGDEIKVGTESFYVISHTNKELNALAKYNLKVGSVYSADGNTFIKKISSLEEGYGIQNENARGVVIGLDNSYGTVVFSNQKGWAYIDYNTIDIKNNPYAEGPIKIALYGIHGYENYIKETISTASVRLIEKREIEALINDGNELILGSDIKSLADAKGYPWIYSTTYYTQSAYVDASSICSIISTGRFTYWSYNFDGSLGVRPVITIPLS